MQSNSAVAVLVQLGPRSVKADVLALLVLDHVLSEDFFHQLRTQDMLGYIVDCHAQRNRGWVVVVVVSREYNGEPSEGG